MRQTSENLNANAVVPVEPVERKMPGWSPERRAKFMATVKKKQARRKKSVDAPRMPRAMLRGGEIATYTAAKQLSAEIERQLRRDGKLTMFVIRAKVLCLAILGDDE